MLIYVVKPGDSLWKISNYYNVPTARIISANGLQYPDSLLVGQSLIIPVDDTINDVKNRPYIYVNGYIYDFTKNSPAIVREVGDYLTYLSPFAYRIREDGSLENIDDSALISAAYTENVVPMMAVTNFTATELGHNLAHVVLSNDSVRENLITNIVETMKNKGYLGVNIDFENVLPDDRENYNRFLELTVERLHRGNFFVSTALAPKTGPGQQGLLYEAHDYEAHGRIVDFVVLMTYEWGYRLGPPQAISPLNRIKQVLDYAVTVIPRQKILFGFQLYARDWVLPHRPGMEAETFSMQEAVAKAVRYQASIQFDTLSQTPFYNYVDEEGRSHQVWFEDARSVQAKFDAVKDYGLRGISYWALGFPFPQNWTLLQDNFNIIKH